MIPPFKFILKINVIIMYTSSVMEAQQTDKKTGPWTEDEHSQFMEGVRLHGKDWTKIVSYVPTRTGTQIRSHAQKFFNKLQYSFESRAILGQESERIMGPPQNQGQYALYKQVGKLLLNEHRQIKLRFLPARFLSFRPFILVSKRRGLRQNMDRDQPLQKRNSKKSQDIPSLHEEISLQHSFLTQKQHSADNHPAIKTKSSFFYEVISSNQNQFGIEESIKNFMKLFVDIKPLSPRKSSNMIVQNEPISTQLQKNQVHCEGQDENNGGLIIQNSCGSEIRHIHGSP